MTDLSPLAVEEYRALRATIRERSSLRLFVCLITFVAWAAAVIWRGPVLEPLFVLVPLVVLAAGFEVVFAIHVGVERIGRYLEIRYESADAERPGWERWNGTAGAASRAGSGIDPLLGRLFAIAGLLNLTPSVMAAAANWPPAALEVWLGVAASLVLHGVFLARIAAAARYAQRQREADLRALARRASTE